MQQGDNPKTPEEIVKEQLRKTAAEVRETIQVETQKRREIDLAADAFDKQTKDSLTAYEAQLTQNPSPLQRLAAELEEAITAGDMARVERLSQQLKHLT